MGKCMEERRIPDMKNKEVKSEIEMLALVFPRFTMGELSGLHAAIERIAKRVIIESNPRFK